MKKKVVNQNSLRDLIAFGPDWKEKEDLLKDAFYSNKEAEALRKVNDVDTKLLKIYRPLAKEGLRSEESIINARQAKIDSGNEFKEALNEAVKYIKRKYHRQSEKESWIASEIIKKAKEWKEQDEKKRFELWDEENPCPVMQLSEILRQKPRKKETILKEIYHLKTHKF